MLSKILKYKVGLSILAVVVFATVMALSVTIDLSDWSGGENGDEKMKITAMFNTIGSTVEDFDLVDNIRR